jgi:heme/copper-type cytochrome/quinol oxidase subunit 3
VKQPDTPFDDPKARFEAGLFGMWIFLVVLSVLFVSVMLGYIVVRVDNGADFIPQDAPPPPPVLLVSTVVLALSSITMQIALRAGRAGRSGQGPYMLATVGLAAVFLALQLFAWRQMLAAGFGPSGSLYAWTFFVLTATHGLHVIGGLPPMLITTARALRGRYGPENHRGIAYCAMYWHFLDAVWVFLYATLWLGSRA